MTRTLAAGPAAGNVTVHLLAPREAAEALLDLREVAALADAREDGRYRLRVRAEEARPREGRQRRPRARTRLGRGEGERLVPRGPAGEVAHEVFDRHRGRERERDIELRFVQDRRRQREELRGGRIIAQKTAAGSEQNAERHDAGFSQRIHGRICDLREPLSKVIGQRPSERREWSDRRVVSHRTDRFFPLIRHHAEDHLDFLARVPERSLQPDESLSTFGVGALDGRSGPLRHHDGAGEQLSIRTLPGQRLADARRLTNRPVDRVDDDQFSRADAPPAGHVRVRYVEDARFRSEQELTIRGLQVPKRPEAVAVERGADHSTVGERERGGAVPRLREAGLVAMKGGDLRRDLNPAPTRAARAARSRARG